MLLPHHLAWISSGIPSRMAGGEPSLKRGICRIQEHQWIEVSSLSLITLSDAEMRQWNARFDGLLSLMVGRAFS